MSEARQGSGLMLMKAFLCGAKDVLNDAYVSVGLAPGVAGESHTGIGISIHDGHDSVSFEWKLENKGDLALLEEMTEQLGKALGLLRAAAKGVVEATGAKPNEATEVKPNEAEGSNG